MLDDYGFEIFETNEFPVAYLLTFRTYGTWHHGNARLSVGRNDMNHYGSPSFQPSVPFVEKMKETQNQATFILSDSQRGHVKTAIYEVCSYRKYDLRAVNVLSDHAHVVASGQVPPEKMVNDFKVYATRRLRLENEIASDRIVWSRGSSTRYLWKPKHVFAAVDYVKYSQEDIPFEFREDGAP